MLEEANSYILSPLTILGPALLVGLLLFIWLGGVIRYIPNDRIGVCEKLWSFTGSVGDGFVALNDEAGFQPEVLRGGFHFSFHSSIACTRSPWYPFHKAKSLMFTPETASHWRRNKR